MASLLSGSLVQAATKLMSKEDHPRAELAARTVTVESQKDRTAGMMKAVTWTGKKSITVADLPRPAVTDPKDAIIRMTSTTICGSDLHLYVGAFPGMKSGAVLGHEAMGIVEDVGPGVTKIKKGDRVVASFCLACGDCYFCQQKLFSACDRTNPEKVQEVAMGARTSGMLGYSTLTGGFDGAQADYFRVPFADVNCLVLPPASELRDEQVLFLSDILPTAWHGCELAQVAEGDVVAIYGAGPVGILTAQCAVARGARRVLLVDSVGYRLEYARMAVPKVEPIDISGKNDPAEKQILKLCRHEPAGAPDAVIECVGCHYACSLTHKLEMGLGLETDSPEALNSALVCVKKGGRVGVIGAYAGMCNHFNIGALMEKGLHVSTGQTPVQRYWEDLLAKVQSGELDASVVVTHRVPLTQAAEAYKTFNEKRDNAIKIVLSPSRTVDTSAHTISA